MRAPSRSATLLGMVTLLAGCVPMVGVAGGKQRDEIVFSIFSCAVPWHDLPVREISVYKVGARKQDIPPDCSLSSTNARTAVLHRWQYGTQPDGFRLGPCAALVAGQAYEIDVDAVGWGQREFRVDGEGAVAWNTWFACW